MPWIYRFRSVSPSVPSIASTMDHDRSRSPDKNHRDSLMDRPAGRSSAGMLSSFEFSAKRTRFYSIRLRKNCSVCLSMKWT